VATLLYDEDCGFCRWSAAKVLAWDRRDRVRAIPLQAREADSLLGAMEPERKMASWHLVTADGTVHSGAAAVAPLARLLPGGRPIAYLGQRFPGLVRLAYGWVSRHRGALGRLLGQKACSVDPRRIGRGRHGAEHAARSARS
jgi:predicted DCC family thiol-disulfide oxidoreductase YuxK